MFLPLSFRAVAVSLICPVELLAVSLDVIILPHDARTMHHMSPAISVAIAFQCLECLQDANGGLLNSDVRRFKVSKKS